MLINNIKFNNTKVHDKENLDSLIHRERHSRFKVMDGKLVQMNVLEKIFDILCKFLFESYYLQRNQNFNNLLTSMVKRLDVADIESVKLIFKKLAPLNEKIFDRSSIQNKHIQQFKKLLDGDLDIEKLDGEIQKYSNELDVAKENKDDETAYELEKKIDKVKTFKEVVKVAKLALFLGIRPKNSESFSKTYLIRGTHQKKYTGVFKTATGDSLSCFAPKFLIRLRNIIFKKLKMGGALHIHIADKAHIAEKASFVVDDFLETGMVPYTDIIHLDAQIYKNEEAYPQLGSFQLFVPGAIAATSFLDVYRNYCTKLNLLHPKARKHTDEISDHDVDKLIILDVITGQMDRHADNILFVPKKTNEKEKMVLIDGGMSFSPMHSNSSFERAKQYYWAKPNFPWVNRKFTHFGKEIIKIAYEKRHELMDKIKKLYDCNNDDVAKDRADRMVERIEMLYYVAIIKDMKKVDLRDFKTQEQIDFARNELKKMQASGA